MSNDSFPSNNTHSINQDFANDSTESNFYNEANDTSQTSESNKRIKFEPQPNQPHQAQHQQQKLEPEYFRKVFVGSLNYNTNEESLRNHFSQFGELVDCVIMKESKTGKSRGFGFVTYKNSSMVDEMMAHRPHRLDGRELETKRATPREESGKPGAETTTKKLFVGAIREGLTEEHLREYFGKYGTIEDCVVMKEKESNKTRGFGFVTFDDYDPVDKIVLERNHIINGQSLAVKKALPKDQTVSGGGRSGHPHFSSRGEKFNPNIHRNSNPRFNPNFNYNNNPNNYNKSNRYNDYSDDFNSNNFHDTNSSGYNNFANNSGNNPQGMPNMLPQMPQMPGGMPNNFANFALLAQKMLQAGFAANAFPNPALNMNNSGMIDPQQMPMGRRGGIINRPNENKKASTNYYKSKGFNDANQSGPQSGHFGPMRDGGNINRRPSPYQQSARKPK